MAAIVDYCGPPPVTLRGNTYVFLFTDGFSHLADMFVVATAECSAEGTPNVFILSGIFPFGGARVVSSRAKAPQCCSKLSHVVYELLGVRKIATSSCRPSGDGGLVRINHTMG